MHLLVIVFQVTWGRAFFVLPVFAQEKVEEKNEIEAQRRVVPDIEVLMSYMELEM